MSPALKNLPPKTIEKILAKVVPAEGINHHLPISVYGPEMNIKAALLKEHAPIYKDTVRWDSLPLSTEIDQVSDAQMIQEDFWNKNMYEHEKEAHFWFTNKPKLYETNALLASRLDFHFHLYPNPNAIATLVQIGTSDDDLDAVDDGRRFKLMLKEYYMALSETTFTESELEGFDEFYTHIEKARVAAQLDKSSQNEDRILRDKIYLYLRDLEETTMKAANTVFSKDKKERARYQSEYQRKRNKSGATSPILTE